MEDWRIGSLLEFLYSCILLSTYHLCDYWSRDPLTHYAPIWVLGPNGYFSREAGNNTWWRNWQAGSPRLLWQLPHQLLHQRQWEKFSSCIEKSFSKIITHTPTYTQTPMQKQTHTPTLTHPCNMHTHTTTNNATLPLHRGTVQKGPRDSNRLER